MASTNSPKEKPGTSNLPRLLTPSEIESLRQEMRQAGEWAKAELKRLNAQESKS